MRLLYEYRRIQCLAACMLLVVHVVAVKESEPSSENGALGGSASRP